METERLSARFVSHRRSSLLFGKFCADVYRHQSRQTKYFLNLLTCGGKKRYNAKFPPQTTFGGLFAKTNNAHADI